MPTHPRTQLALIALALLFWGSGQASLGAKEGEEHLVLRFNPPSGTDYLEQVTSRREQVLPGRGSVVDVSVTRRRVVISTTDEGFEMKSTPISLQATRNGRPFPNPTLEVLTGAVVKLQLAKDGDLKSVEGYEGLARAEGFDMPPAVRERLPVLLDPEMLRARTRTEWAGRFGAFLGREFKPGEVLRQESELPLGDGRSVTYTTETRFVGLVPCGARNCGLIEFVFDSHGSSWKDAPVPAEDPGKEAIAKVSGAGSRVIDLETMLILSERLERTVTVRQKHQEKALDRVLKESREYQVRFTEPSWPGLRLDPDHVAALATENHSQ